MSPKRPAACLAALTATVGLAACGSSGSGSGTTASSAPATASTPATASAPAATAAPSRALTVTTTEYAFAPTTLAAKAGKVEVTLDNKGSIPHEFVVLKTDAAADALKSAGGGRVSEDDSVGEVSETDGGKTKSATLDLKPGRYVYVCNIPGHYMDGMRGVLTVK